MRRPSTLALLSCTAALAALAPRPAAAVDPGSQLVTCDRANQVVTLTATSHLDPSCTWTRGVEIVASNVTLDCQGAHIAAPDRRYGVYIHAPVDTPLTDITVRNCHVEGFLNNYHIEREGFRELAAGVEYENGFSNITIEDGTSKNSRGVGIFVNGYVEGVTLRNLRVEGASSSGIYLEAGSKNGVVENNLIIDNGYGENGPAGGVRTLAGIDFWYWGTGREGLSIDGSRFNVVRNNVFQTNTAGGIYLYKNCGEYWSSRPQRWYHRRYGADGNVIENNTFVGEDNGIWVGSRMSENIFPMECSDPQYAPGYALDYADDNVIRNNRFEDVTFGIRVEDDGTEITGNTFTSSDPIDEAIVVGTQHRTLHLGQPVAGTVIADNVANITGSPNPYRFIWGHTNTTFANNESLGKVVSLCEGVQPPRGPFVMTVDVILLPNPPPVEIKELPPPGLLPPCRTSCETGSALARANLVLKKLDTPAADDGLIFKGDVVVPHPFTPALDPATSGAVVVIADSTGVRALDATIPGGAYDPVTKVGWKAAKNGLAWKYTAKVPPVGGITVLSIKDLSKKTPGLVQIKVTGKNGAYAVNTANLPLTGVVILDPPTGATGQCGTASFDAPLQGCRTDGKTVKCK
ncbi:MAG: right-handed parallel beta-helix repeat-containing protein [bacterium]|nr:right-handed parallel beta-helix repeat-containing protein [bacterium]